MAERRQSGVGTAKRRVASPLAVCAAIFLLAAQGVAPRVAAQGQSVVEGTLEVHVEDSYTGARLTHHLNTGTERIVLRFVRNPPERLLTGDRVRARGTRRHRTLLTGANVSRLPSDVSLTSSDTSSIGSEASGSGGGGSGDSTVPLSSPHTLGAQRTLVILFNFQDLTGQPYTAASAQSVTFNEVSDFYLENSFGQTWLHGSVAGWFTIASSSASCNYTTWSAQAEEAAIAAGYDLSLYPRRVFGFPQTSACSWWGLATVGGGSAANPSRAWVNGPYSLRVVAHEMGHNFGLNHSRSSACDAGGCVVDEYGDDHDVMGALTGHFNAFQKERLGWLGYGSSPAIQRVVADGQYPLEPYATPNGGLPKALRILKSSTGSSNTYIYAEARTQFGADGSLAPGVVIHSGVDTDGLQIYLHDLEPASPVIDFILDPGQSFTFTDAVPPVTITTLAFDSAGAVIAVDQACHYTLASPGQSFALAGGAGSVELNTASDCAWSATSNDSWISVEAGSTSGAGPSTIGFTVAANTDVSGRTGTMTIGGETFTVTQAGAACDYTVSPTNPAFPYTAGSGTLNLTTTSGCAWAAASNVPWISINSAASGTGSGIVTYALQSNSPSRTSRSGTLTVAGQMVTVTQEGVAALFVFPGNGQTGVFSTSLFIWTAAQGASRYVLTVGTTPGGADVWNSGEIGQTSTTVPNMPVSRLLYARVRTKFTTPTLLWTQSDITFTTVDHVSSVQVLGAQTPNPVVQGQTAQYGASAGTSVQIGFTGAGGSCTATLSATGLPSGASAIFTPNTLTSAASNQFSLLTISTTGATPVGSFPFTVKAQCGSTAGGPAASAGVTINVAGPPNAPPTVSMTSPPNGAVFTAPAAITLSADAADVDGSVDRVDFFANGSLVGSDTTAPYTIGWNTSTIATHTLTAQAIDNAGAGATTAPVSITVNAVPVGDVVIYASDVGSVNGTWSKVSDPTAAAGIKLTNPDNSVGALASPLANPANYFDATFAAVAGTRYRVWLRIHPRDDSKWNDSVFVQFSDAIDGGGNPVYRIGSPTGYLVNLWQCANCTTSGWGWQRNAYWLPDTGDVRFERTGTHTIRVQVREDGAEIDQIILSPTTYAETAPGAESGDGTIVPKPGLPVPPGAPSTPNPSNGTTNAAATITLTWTASAATTYDVSFGTTNPPPAAVSGLTTASHTVSGLATGTTYFWQVVARNPAGTTSGQVWAFTTAPVAVPRREIVIYASDIPQSALHGTWSVASDPTSPNGRTLLTPDAGWASTAAPLANPADYVDVTFTADANTRYTVWFRLKALANNKFNDAVWVQFSDAFAGGVQVYPMNGASGLLVNLATDASAKSLDNWGWQNGAYWLSQPVTVTFPTSGSHTLRIQVREDGVRLDQIVLSSVAHATAAPGPVGGDSTIVPKP